MAVEEVVVVEEAEQGFRTGRRFAVQANHVAVDSAGAAGVAAEEDGVATMMAAEP